MTKPTTSSTTSTSDGDLFVTPAPGLKVRDPKSGLHLSADGQRVPRDSYWLRRLADGDVIEATAPAAAKE
jgi:hypothetical protein